MTEAQKEVAAKGRNVQMVDGTVVNFGEKTRMKKELITDNPYLPSSRRSDHLCSSSWPCSAFG
mgnify:CR=1 FL=1